MLMKVISFLKDSPASSSIVLLIMVLSLYAFINKKGKPTLGLYPYYMLRRGEYYRLLTSTFIHLNPLHFILNVVSFVIVGFAFEKLIGSLGFLVVYIGSLIISSAIVAYQHRDHQSYNSIGASGPIIGMILGWMWIRSDVTISIAENLSIPIWVLGFAFLVYSYFSSIYSTSNVNHRAHLWGGLSGIMLTIVWLHVLEFNPNKL